MAQEDLREEKIFSEKEIQDALNEPLTAMRGSVPDFIPHLAYKLKRQGGDIIKTNIELNTQRKVEKLVSRLFKSTDLEKYSQCGSDGD